MINTPWLAMVTNTLVNQWNFMTWHYSTSLPTLWVYLQSWKYPLLRKIEFLFLTKTFCFQNRKTWQWYHYTKIKKLTSVELLCLMLTKRRSKFPLWNALIIKLILPTLKATFSHTCRIAYTLDSSYTQHQVVWSASTI